MAAMQGTQSPHVVLRGISWGTYQRLLQDHVSSSAPHFTYDRGTLENVSPLAVHERDNRRFQLLLPVLAERYGADLESLGSTTFQREDAQRGFEPDSCFYLEHAERVRGKERIDLQVDPPPDLVVAVDVTHSSIDKLPIYHQFGVPEVWRYDGQRLQFLGCGDLHYVERGHSRAFPALPVGSLAALLAEGRSLGDLGCLRRARQWAQALPDDAPGQPAAS